MTSSTRVHNTPSTDGTRISYRNTGAGPGLIIVPGVAAVAEEFDGIASELSSSFEVSTMDRRGHGQSGAQGERYCLERELEDIEAVRAVTGATFLLGHSFGGFLVLEALRTTSAYRAAAVYDPGVLVDEAPQMMEMAWADRSAKEFDNGKVVDAFITFLQGVNPDTTGRAPRAALKLILPFAMGRKELSQKSRLIPETIREHREAVRVGNQPSRYRHVETPVLFMAGKEIATTAAGRAARKLSSVLPHATLTTFPKLDHFGMENAPATVGAAVKAAFDSANSGKATAG